MGSPGSRHHCTMKSFSLLLVILISTIVVSEDVVRKPRLFYVSTSSTTTTISTASICVVTSTNTLPACTGRKRRMITRAGETEALLQPSRTQDSRTNAAVNEEEATEVETGSSGREGRFLLYWITTTSVSTSTSYTTTFSISSVLCTAPGQKVCG